MFKPHSESLPYLKYVVDNGNSHNVYLFRHEYDSFNPEIQVDPSCGLRYVILPNTDKRLYFSRDMETGRLLKLYKALTMEQDPRSPHRYCDNIEEFKGRTLVDVGAAEGILSLMAIEQVSGVVLFECEERWIEALEKTFEPWKDKITIVRKYVGDRDDDNNITLDTYFADKPHDQLFLKMDIEGMERQALSGANRLFAEKGNTEFAICTYHRHDDPEVIKSFLDRYHCQYTEQFGYFAHKYKSVMLRGRN